MAEVTTAQPTFLDTIGNWVNKAGQIFTGLSDVYVAADQRVKALESINEDTVKTTQTAKPSVDSGAKGTMPQWVIPALAVGGALILILLARKLR